MNKTMPYHSPNTNTLRQSGVALFVVIVFVMLSMLLALCGPRVLRYSMNW